VKTPLVSLRGVCRQLGARPQGFSTAEVAAPGYTITQVRRAIDWLIKHRELHTGRASHKVVRYFSSRADADAYETRYATMQASNRKPVAQAPWPAGTQAIYPTNPDGSPAYKHTVIPHANPEHARRPRPVQVLPMSNGVPADL